MNDIIDVEYLYYLNDEGRGYTIATCTIMVRKKGEKHFTPQRLQLKEKSPEGATFLEAHEAFIRRYLCEMIKGIIETGHVRIISDDFTTIEYEVEEIHIGKEVKQ